MEIIPETNACRAAQLGAQMLAALIRTKPQAVLGLATGGTPVALYRELIRMHQEDGLDFSQVTTFNLDEYVGLTANHPASYHQFMQRNLFDHINIDSKRIHIPDGMAGDIPAFCRNYEAAIADAGGIDIQLLGIGRDGHIGFNEPGSSLQSRTRLKTLTQETRRANQRFFPDGEKVPHHVITMGIATIMEARTCLILAFGDEKAEAVEAMVEGPITAMCPASILQMHPQTIVILDEPAASRLKRIDYYRTVQAHKPRCVGAP